ncbi:MAG: DUF3553 domain-containing protein [Dechloromonas sp.]|uniref:DUF3553 domain-containing protein n=1 Tax=Candidatus Dechloromonas phosphorivorans TaxID=2899244 RepID=A0A935JY89_9RHOO|nr:DUF3553 domain-containing protein [Candidatus Dechloromonas phosphorivorans]
MSNPTQGDRVFHPNQKGWGLGKVLNVTPDNIDVFFVGTGAKRLSKSFVQLEIAEGAAAKHRLLDNLIDTSQIINADYVTPAMAIQRFLVTYPEGFATPRFLKDERDSIVRAHQLCIQLLGEEEITGLIAERRFQDICDRARHIESVTTLLTKSEKTAFYAALEQPVQQKTFSLALADLLYGTDTEENRFKAFVRALDLLGINRWPYATLFGFLRFPQEKAYIKPTMIQNVAKAFCWRIHYKSEPNWRTYAAVLRLYSHLRTSLIEEGMMPRDQIDVQSIVWSVGQK